jgi:hypothetical protein
MQWIWDPNQSNELENNIKIKNIRNSYRGINDFKKGYQPSTNAIKDGKGDKIKDFHGHLARWRNHLSQLFIVHGVNYVKHRNTYSSTTSV